MDPRRREIRLDLLRQQRDRNPHETWWLAYENFPRTSVSPDSATKLLALAMSVVAASFGSSEPGINVGITPAIRTAPGPAICRMP